MARIGSLLCTVLVVLTFATPVLAQVRPRPVTRQEIIDQLSQSANNPRQSGQADLADLVTERGIDFQADEQALEEFRRLGARSFLLNVILLASQATSGPPGNPDHERPRLRPAVDPPAPQSQPDLPGKSLVASVICCPSAQRCCLVVKRTENIQEI